MTQQVATLDPLEDADTALDDKRETTPEPLPDPSPDPSPQPGPEICLKNDSRRAEDRSFIASIPMGRRIWAVPSIHGEKDALEALHERLATRFRPGEDRLVYLGNYLGRGPDILGTIDELLRFRRAALAGAGAEPWDIIYLRGAQEEMWWKLLKLQIANAPADVLKWMMAHGVDATLSAYGCDIEDGLRHCRGGTMALTRWTGKLRKAMQAQPGHSELLTSLWRAATTGDGGMLFVHASVDPSRPLSMQGDIFWWDDGTFEQIEQPVQGFAKVIRGYDNDHLGPSLEREHSATLDAGCGFSGPLVAACFDPGGQLVDAIDASDVVS